MKKMMPLILLVSVAYGMDIRPSWAYSTDNFGGKAVQWGFVQNERAPLHLIGGSLIAVGLDIIPIELSSKTKLLLVTGIGIGWEVYQTTLFGDFRKVRQSERYWFDATGDAVSTALGAFLMTRDFGKFNLSVTKNLIELQWPL